MRSAAAAALRLPQWTGETVFVLGGGPSLRGFDVSRLAGRRIIGVNESGLTLCPWADVLFWADRRWVDWNLIAEDRIRLHTGDMRITTNSAYVERIPRCRLLKWAYKDDAGNLVGFDTRPGHLAGFDAGGRCINLAYHFGAQRVVLLGFDCRDYPPGQRHKGNFHTAHKLPPLDMQRKNKFVPAHEAMAAKLEKLRLDFTVWNATPDSALECWPKAKLEIFL